MLGPALTITGLHYLKIYPIKSRVMTELINILSVVIFLELGIICSLALYP